MNRPRSRNANLADYPRLKARALKTKTRYYYRRGKKDEPLGDNLQRALERYHQIEASGSMPGNIDGAFEQWRNSPEFTDLSDKTKHEYGKAIIRLVKVYGRGTWADFRPEHLSLYVKQAKAKVRAQRDIACLSSMWSWARSEGLTDLPNPRIGLRFKAPRKEQPGVTQHEFQALYAVAVPELRDLLDLLYLTGQDVNRVAAWKRSDIVDGHLNTRRTKTGAAIRIQVSGDFAAVIQRCLTRKRAATGPWIVQTDKGQRLTPTMIAKRLAKAREASGVHFELRAIRRQTASDSDTAVAAQELLGHQDIRTTKRFYRKGEKVRPLK